MKVINEIRIILIIAIILIGFYYYKKNKRKKCSIENKEENENVQIENNCKYKYEPKYLMTINEKAQYKKIKEWANKNNLIVFSKIRLLDLITPRKNEKNYKGALWKIQAKHIDFVVCDQDIKVKCIIEISDNSHNRKDRTDRDNFVSEILQNCGYKILTTYNVTEEELNNICSKNKSTP